VRNPCAGPPVDTQSSLSSVLQPASSDPHEVLVVWGYCSILSATGTCAGLCTQRSSMVPWSRHACTHYQAPSCIVQGVAWRS
jgi:hypothetical protein